MKTIHCALELRLTRDAEIKAGAASGRRYLTLAGIVGEEEKEQWVNAVSFSATDMELAPSLTAGVTVYVEGSLTLRGWGPEHARQYGLSVMAWLIQPKGLIGNRRPKAPPRTGGKRKVDSQTPLLIAGKSDKPFDDAIPF